MNVAKIWHSINSCSKENDNGNSKCVFIVDILYVPFKCNVVHLLVDCALYALVICGNWSRIVSRFQLIDAHYSEFLPTVMNSVCTRRIQQSCYHYSFIWIRFNSASYWSIMGDPRLSDYTIDLYWVQADNGLVHTSMKLKSDSWGLRCFVLSASQLS